MLRPSREGGSKFPVTTLLVAWNACTLFALFSALRHLTEAQQDALFYYYQPLVPILGMLWLWGVNVSYFEKGGVSYEALFSAEEQYYLLKGQQIREIGGVVTTMFTTSVCVFATLLNMQSYTLAVATPMVMYLSLFLLAIFPGNVLYSQVRQFFSKTVARVILPFQRVTFSDFILADILTSLAKALADVQRAACLWTQGPMDVIVGNNDALNGVCGRRSWHVNFVLALPYLIRLCQCIMVYRHTKDTPQLFNAVKYGTVFPVIILSTLKHQFSPENWEMYGRPLWVLSSCINTCYSYYWDVEMDWDIAWFSASSGKKIGIFRVPQVKADALYPLWFYFWAMGSNFFIRIAWIYKLSSHLRYMHSVTFIVGLLEVFRRFQWVFIRIECGLRKAQHLGHKSSGMAVKVMQEE